MFAYVYYVIDKQLAKVPVGYIKHFEIKRYDEKIVYKVFWSRFIHSIQNENDDASMARLRSLIKPPSKDSWNTAEGDGFYNAFILRVEESLEVLVDSIRRKRPTLPLTTQYEDLSSSTTEDEVAILQFQKSNKKREESEMKKREVAAKRMRAEEIFKTANSSRKRAFRKIVNDSDCSDTQDSDEGGPQVIPMLKYTELKAAYDILEKEKKIVDEELERAEKKFCELKKKNDDMKIECDEVVELRSLNRQLQQRLLNVPITQGGCFNTAGEQESQAESNSETMEVELGAGISISRQIYKDIFELDHVRKFTKSLAVAIWGTKILAGRSVKGRPCRNRNGPKKMVPGAVQTEVPGAVQTEVPGAVQTEVNPQESKPPLTPEKLSVISGQMREYLTKRGKGMPEIEIEIKNRNRYISDKIQDICNNMARAEARNKSFSTP